MFKAKAGNILHLRKEEAQNQRKIEEKKEKEEKRQAEEEDFLRCQEKIEHKT